MRTPPIGQEIDQNQFRKFLAENGGAHFVEAMQGAATPDGRKVDMSQMPAVGGTPPPSKLYDDAPDDSPLMPPPSAKAPPVDAPPPMPKASVAMSPRKPSSAYATHSTQSRLADAQERDRSEQYKQNASDYMRAALTGQPNLRPLQDSAVQRLEQQQEAGAADVKASKTAEAGDPQSEASFNARAKFASLDIGKKMAERMGPDFERMSAAQLEQLFPGLALAEAKMPDGELTAALLQQRNDSHLKSVADREKAAQEKGRVDAFLAAAGAAGIDPNMIQRLGSTPGMTLDAAKAALAPIHAKLQQDQSFKNSEKLKALGEYYDIKGEARADARKADEETVLDANGNAVRATTVDEAKKVREAKAEKDTLVSGIANLRAKVAKAGTWERILSPSVRGDIEASLRDLQLRAKGQALYQLGVLSGPDLVLLEQITGDPTSWRTLFTDVGPFLNKIQSLEERVNASYASKVNSVTRAPAGGGTVKMRFPDGSTHDVAPGEVELAKRKGGQPL